MRSPVHTRYEDLPEELPIFPLSGALLLPWGRLPLNIFEPRYLNMTLDALKQGRLFGMIQPDYEKTPRDSADDSKAPKAEPVLYRTGCVGRIGSFEETEDGRILIVLKGLIRFRTTEEIEGRLGYRRVRASYTEFKHDLEPPEKFDLDRPLLHERLKAFLDVHHMPMNPEVLKGLSDATLLTSLCMLCPFDPREKQALLESGTVQERANILLKLLQMGAFAAQAADATRQ